MNGPSNTVPASIAQALLQILRKDFPVFRDYTSLAIGIDKQICARLPEVDKKVLRVALAMHTKSTPYLRQMSKAKNRIDLDGNVAEELTPPHREYAADVLKERAKRNEAFQKAQRDREQQAQHAAAEAEAAQRRAAKLGQLMEKFSRVDR